MVYIHLFDSLVSFIFQVLGFSSLSIASQRYLFREENPRDMEAMPWVRASVHALSQSSV